MRSQDAPPAGLIPCATMESLEPRLLLSADPLTLPRIIDDGDASFTTTGDWTVTAGAGHADDQSTIIGGDGEAVWTFSGLSPGYRYLLSATWTAGADRTSDARFTVVNILNHSSVDPSERGQDKILGLLHVDQRAAPNDLNAAGATWEDLGVFLVRGTTLSVTLSGGADGVLVADGLRIERMGTWQPPIGVPVPEFGIEDSHWMYADAQYTFDYGNGPEPYRIGADGPYTHYIDNTHPNATDTNNLFGTPDRPRLTIPYPLPAGSVAEVHGGPYDYGIQTATSGWGGKRLPIVGLGTQTHPVFVRGPSMGSRPIFDSDTYNIWVEGTYVIVENLDVQTSIVLRPKTDLGGEGHHISLRRLEIHDIDGHAVLLGWPHGGDNHPEYLDPALIHHAVIYNSVMHDIGPDWQAGPEADYMGVFVGINSDTTWILDNEMHYIDGDCIHLNCHGIENPTIVQSPPHLTFVGRNTLHHAKENCIDTKVAYDTIVSQNRMYGIRSREGSDGTIVVIQTEHETPDFPYQDRAWHLFNEVFDGEVGYRIENVDNVYLIGNVIHDIVARTLPLLDSGWSTGAAIQKTMGYTSTIANNTIYNCDLGIISPTYYASAQVNVENNIIAGLTGNFEALFGNKPYGILVRSGDVAGRSRLQKNLLFDGDGIVGIAWGHGSPGDDLPEFPVADAYGNLKADPRFVDPAAGDFRLSWPTDPSPAVDAGMSIQPYVDLFAALYGLDIGVDFNGVARPQRNGIDIGAFEASNTAPEAADDAVTIAEDAFALILPASNDTDAEGDVLHVASFTQPAHGTVVRLDERTLRYTPDHDWHGTDSFTYIVSDSMGGTATGTVTVTVTPVNDAPALQNDSVTTAEDAAVTVSVLDNDADVEGDTLEIQSFTQPSHGAVVQVGDGMLRYTPTADWHGTDSFTYTASDGAGGTATATVTVTVQPVNDAPLAVNDNVAINEDAAAVIFPLLNDSDADDDDLTILNLAQPSHGAVINTGGGRLIYTPHANRYGTDEFTYTVSDGNGGTHTATVTVTVASVNDAPALQDDSVATAEDTAIAVNVLANDEDVDGDTLEIQSFTQPSHGAVVQVGEETLRYTPADDWHGTDTFTYTVSDGNGGTATATVTIVVQPVNDAPQAVEDHAETDEDAPVAILPLRNDLDIDDDDLAVVAFTQPSHGTVADGGGGRLIYTPAANWYGADEFTYTVSDGNGGTHTGTVTVNVTEAPYVVNLDDRGQATFIDGAGNTVIVTLRGPGTGQLYFPEQGDCDMRRLVLSGTTARSSVLITSRGWERRTTIGKVTADGSLASFVGRGVDLLGDLAVFGSLGQLVLDDVHDAWITIGSDEVSAPPLSVTLGQVTDTSLISAIPLKALTVADWVNTDAQADAIEAPWIGSLIVRGQPASMMFGIAAGRGDFDPALMLDGADRRGVSLGRLFVAGRLASDVSLAGSAAAIRAGQWDAGSLAAASVASLLLRAPLGGGVLTGDLAIDLDLTGADARTGLSLGRLQVFGAVTDATITLAGGAGTLSAAQWNGGTLTAGTVAALTAQGVFGSALLHGDFTGDLTLTGTDRRGNSLGRLAISGRLAADMVLAGGAGAIQAAQWDEGSLQATALSALVLRPSFLNDELDGSLAASIDLSGTLGRSGLSLGKMQAYGAVNDSNITLAGGAGTLAASQWNGGSLTAETVASLAVQGRWNSDTLRGDFSGTLTLTGSHPKTGLSLSRFLATGTVTNPVAGVGGGEDEPSISLAGGAGAVFAGQWNVGRMTASTIASFTVQPTMWSGAGVTGGFSGVLDLDGRTGAGLSLGALSVAGAMQDATVRTSGSIGTLTTGALLHSDVLAGCDDAVQRHAAAAEDFVDGDAQIRSVLIRGVATSAFGAVDRCFEDSNLSAARFGTVSLINPELDSDTDFGLWARHSGSGEFRAFICTDALTGDQWQWRPGRAATTNGQAFREQNLVIYLV
ncbi:MAG: tandem-95 repeat protein [Planctomycetes bacterium]|nr:tandem-95 repeat protein [Planctomycetota bacterium]